jgi:L-iditol 2-dehydrogenase
MTANGGFAQYVVNNINTVHPIPEHVEFNEAALVTNLGCVLYGFETIGGFVAGQSVAILGPGPIGLIATQVAKALGAEKVYLTGTRASRLNMGAERGADRLININEEDPVPVVLAETGGVGVDLAVDAAGVKSTPMEAIKMTRPMGKILMLGIPHEPVVVDLEDLLMKNKSIHTVRGEGRSNVARAISLLSTGKISLKPYLTHVFPLDQIDDAFETFVKRIDGAVKVVVKSNE